MSGDACMDRIVKALVLRESTYKDNDKILTLLTTDGTLISTKARGVKKLTSRIRAACQILAFSEFTISDARGFSTVKEAEPLEMFLSMRSDIERLSLAMYFAQIGEIIAQEDAPSSELLRLLLSALQALCKGRAQTVVKSAFELRLMALGGYAPDVSACAVCGKKTPDRFNVTQARVQCATCEKNLDELCLPISAGTLDAMRYVLAASPEKVFGFSLGDATAAEFAGVTEAYLLTRLERGFSTLDFYHSLQVVT